MNLSHIKKTNIHSQGGLSVQTQHLAPRLNKVKDRILQLSPSVKSGAQPEQSRDDYESLLSSSIGIGGFSKVYKVRHKQSKMVYAIKVISK